MRVSVYSREAIESVIADGKFPKNTAVIGFCDPELKHIDKDYSRVDYSSACEEYKKAMDSLVAAETELLNTYPQIRELFDKYQSAQFELISINNRQEFVNGFRIGGQVVMEMLRSIE